MSERHEIPTITEVSTWRSGHFKSDAVLLIAGTCSAGGPGGWGVGGWTEQGEGRLVQGGPMLPGPQAFIFGRAGVIDCYGGTKAEHERLMCDGLLFRCADGDTLILHGTEYVLRVDRRGYPTLEQGGTL